MSGPLREINTIDVRPPGLPKRRQSEIVARVDESMGCTEIRAADFCVSGFGYGRADSAAGFLPERGVARLCCG